MELIILPIFYIAIAFITATIAVRRGRSSLGWFILGLLFSFIALIILLIMPSKIKSIHDVSPETHNRCPDCKEFVLKAANVCKHCGCKLTPDAA